MKIAQGSKSWIIITLLLGLFFLIISVVFRQKIFGIISLFICVVLLILAGFFILFFRDPDRKTGKGIVACADGKIREIKKIKDKKLGECFRISTFMNIYDVHVNRMPMGGLVKDVTHISGGYVPAFKKESERNERVIFTIITDIGMVKIIQIAGTIARRIVPYIGEGDNVKKGEKIGIIRLGSRVDIYLPSEKIKKIVVKSNDRIRAGESTIAEIND